MKQLCILFSLILLLSACGSTSPGVSDVLGLNLSGGTVLTASDTHGGFHGDGETLITFQCQDLVIPEIAYWHALPLSENAARALALFDDCGDAASVTNGFYFFYDRHRESIAPTDDSALFSRASWNFTLAVYDADTQPLYYFELDT